MTKEERVKYIIRITFKLYYKTRVQIMKERIKNNKSFSGVGYDSEDTSCYNSFNFKTKETLYESVREFINIDTVYPRISYLFLFESRKEFRTALPQSQSFVHRYCWNIAYLIDKYSEDISKLKRL